jgi:hypothetical protein
VNKKDALRMERIRQRMLGSGRHQRIQVVQQIGLNNHRAMESAKPRVAAAGRLCSPRCTPAVRVPRMSVVVLFFFLTAFFLRAQGTLDYVVLQTGGEEVLVSEQELLQTGGVLLPALAFDFGFITDEIQMPGAFLDSFTVTIQDGASATAVLVTIDASGALWAPFSPGSVFFSDSDIERIASVPPGMQPISGRGVAYSVNVPLPTQFSGPSLTVYFDLFDNMNQTMSLGWYSNPRIVPIPEPQSGWLLALGAGSLWAAFKRKRKK